MVEIIRRCENLKSISTFKIHLIPIKSQSDLTKYPIYTIKIDLHVLKSILMKTLGCRVDKKMSLSLSKLVNIWYLNIWICFTKMIMVLNFVFYEFKEW